MPVWSRKGLLSPVVCLCAGIALILCAGAAGAGGQSARPPEQPSLSVQAGQMLMLGFRGLTAESSDWILDDIRAGRAGGVILFDYDVQLDRPVRNIKNFDQVKTLIHDLQAAARLPLLVAVDQEGGRVCRLKPRHGFPDFPGAQELGSINDPGLTETTAHRMGRLLAELGFNCNLAPVV
ncbi:MAG: glycoside hydrolase family 3, partial [Desulfohalobiaceae bacterium]|nr:glycoside hydrolase family 3 [Desulfohalobiaceae bacterium]